MKTTSAAFLVLTLTVACRAAERPVFPGAQGFGIHTLAGRGGRFVRVTNLNADGPGSLRQALDAKGPRVVVFEVGGVIDLNRNNLTIREPFLTVAGQTAPSPGITLMRGGLRIATHDLLIQHLRVRPGDPGQPKRSGWEPEVTTSGPDCYNIVIEQDLQHAGARPRDRDQTGRRIIREFRERKGRFIDSQNEVGGYPKPVMTSRKLAAPAQGIDEWLAKLAAGLE